MSLLVKVLLLALSVAAVSADAEVLTAAGGFDGSFGTSSALDVRGLAIGNDGIFFTDFAAHRLRLLDHRLDTQTIFGSVPGSSNKSPFTLNKPWGIVKDPNSPLFREVFWVASSGGDQTSLIEEEKPALKIVQYSDDILLVENAEVPLNFDPTAGMVLPNGDIAFVSNGNSNIRIATFNRATEGPVRVIATDGVGPESFLEGIAYNPNSGYFYVADSEQHVIWEVDDSGFATVVAGSYGAAGFDSSHLNTPRGLVYRNETDELIICDSGNNAIRVITVVDDRKRDVEGGSLFTLDVFDYSPSAIILPDGSNGTAIVGATEDTYLTGQVFYYDLDTGAVDELVGVDPNTLDGFGTEARFGFPSGMEFERGSSGLLWIGDDGGLRTFDPVSREVVTIAGTTPRGGSSDGAIGGTGTIGRVTDIAFSRDNQIVYFTEVNPGSGPSTSRVRELRFDDKTRTTASVRTLVDGLGEARGIALDLDNSILYFTDSLTRKVWSFFLATGQRDLVAGSGLNLDDDGLADRASFLRPTGIDIDVARQVLYVADTGAHKIKEIDIDLKSVVTIAGSGDVGSDNGLARDSTFWSPQDVAVSPLGIVWIADTKNGLLRGYDIATETVSTVAGSVPGERDGLLLRARLNNPISLAVDVARGSTPVYAMSLEGRRLSQIGTVDVCKDMECADLNTCTTEGCNSGLGIDACFSEFNTDRCDDGNVCTIGDYCDGAGNCIAGRVGNEGAICFTGDLCFEDQRCNNNGQCVGVPVSCDDENACTIDTCVPLLGCVHEQRVCFDGNECTDDVCISDIGCTFPSNDNFCNADNNPCTVDQCSLGSCVVVEEKDCDDGNPCNEDFCDAILGCMSTRAGVCTGRNFVQDLDSCACECNVEAAQLGCEHDIDELQCLCLDRPNAEFISIRVEYTDDLRRSVRAVENTEMLLEAYAAAELNSDDVQLRNELAGVLSVPEELLYLVGATIAKNGNRAIVLDVFGQEQLSAASLLSILASSSGCAKIDDCTVATNSTVGALGVTHISRVRAANPPPIPGIEEEGGGGNAYVDPIELATVPQVPFTDTVPYSIVSVPSDPRIVYVSVDAASMLSVPMLTVLLLMVAVIFG